MLTGLASITVYVLNLENALKFFQLNPETAAIGGRIEMGLSTDPSAAALMTL